ncbi:DUF86 domain-containing protein [Mesotoga sp.]|uniref:HepT-like ribonuclease domain-containing protein n=1 Tax=Mesotoga sp. TaxID=2053577 RepID=UPI00356351E1
MNDIINEIDQIADFRREVRNADEFTADKKTVRATIRSLEIIGKAVKRLPSEVIDKHPETLQRSIAGMRDTLIHESFGVNLALCEIRFKKTFRH